MGNLVGERRPKEISIDAAAAMASIKDHTESKKVVYFKEEERSANLEGLHNLLLLASWKNRFI